MDELVAKQRKFFLTHRTLDVEFRRQQLIILKRAILKYEQKLYAGLYKDFKKSKFETYETEIGMILEEIKYTINNIRKWAKPRKVKTPLTQFKSTSKVFAEPYGIVLVMSPWNYPLLLTLSPVIGAIAAGNCCVIKTSRYAAYTSKILRKMIEEFFKPEYLTVVEGGREANEQLLNQKFDYIFFTGSPHVGKIVMQAAAQNLTPVTLELGGKSPCIVDETAPVSISAKRIVWGKLLNAGQTCVAPDYILVHKSIKDQLIKELKKVIIIFYGKDPQKSSDFPRIINSKHVKRLRGLINQDKVVFGGIINEKDKYISPTIMDNITWDDPVMQEEIFGPIFPILTFETIDEVIELLNIKPKPLALYYFSKNKQRIEEVLKKVSYGGGCINDTIMHLANVNMPFGGVGNSGMGGYHGKDSFNTFSHYKSVLNKSLGVDVPVRYAPYNQKKLNTVKKLLK